MRPVQDVARAAEAPLQGLRVDRGQASIVRIEHQVAGHALGPVAAGMLACMEQPQVVVVAHRHAAAVTAPA
jgi:hypothetical protein